MTVTLLPGWPPGCCRTAPRPGSCCGSVGSQAWVVRGKITGLVLEGQQGRTPPPRGGGQAAPGPSPSLPRGKQPNPVNMSTIGGITPLGQILADGLYNGAVSPAGCGRPCHLPTPPWELPSRRARNGSSRSASPLAALHQQTKLNVCRKISQSLCEGDGHTNMLWGESSRWQGGPCSSAKGPGTAFTTHPINDYSKIMA